LELAAKSGPVLDLACGHGRNGLYLTDREISVVFADINPTALGHVQKMLSEKPARQDSGKASLWSVNLEQPGNNPFNDRMFGGMVAFNYLHRPLFEHIKRAVHPGGIVLYETFTIDQATYGRPKNPAFLLQPGELLQYFNDWDILHYFEGVVENEAATGSKAIAQLAAQRPASR
jgi:SAM-dependent methyltransferase